MNHNSSGLTTNDEPLPLHELISRILAPEEPPSWYGLHPLPVAGTMQSFSQALAHQPLLNFINATLRGVGQVIFVNNPLSGLCILVALFLQSPWVAAMSIVGGAAATLAAMVLKLDETTIRNGIFGYNGILVGAALATFGAAGNGTWNLAWMLAVALLAALTTVLMKTLGMWFVIRFKVPVLTLPFNLVTLVFLGLVIWIPQSVFMLGLSAPSPALAEPLNGLQLAQSFPVGFGQVFLADNLMAGILVLLAVAICTPIGAVVGLIGCGMGGIAGLMLGVAPDSLYAGLWGYNAILTAMAIGGVFYAPTFRSIAIGAIAAFLAAITGGILGVWFASLGLPVLTVPFCVVTLGFFLVLQRSLPSLVPVALHAVASPEEHWQRFMVARSIITNFRQQLKAAMVGERRTLLFAAASASVKGNLRYVFDAIDRDRNGLLSTQELASHLRQAGQVASESELLYLFKCMDADGSGAIDFEEFGELMLRHRRLMAKYTEFLTYFLPIDADADDVISLNEMNTAMASVGERALLEEEISFLQQQTGGQPLLWNRFIEVLLVT